MTPSNILNEACVQYVRVRNVKIINLGNEYRKITTQPTTYRHHFLVVFQLLTFIQLVGSLESMYLPFHRHTHFLIRMYHVFSPTRYKHFTSSERRKEER